LKLNAFIKNFIQTNVYGKVTIDISCLDTMELFSYNQSV